MHRVLISDPLSEDGIKPLLEAEDIETVMDSTMSYEQLLEAVASAEALIVRSQTQVTREVIEHAPHLKIIGRAGVGVDNIDIDAATENGVIVVNAPDGNTISTAEHTMAMLMSLARNIPQAYHQLQQKRWERKKFVGVELKDKVLGIVGFGRIGREVAQRAKGHRMKVIAFDPFLNEEKAEKSGVTNGSLDEVLQQADFLTVHTPLIEKTKHLINEETISVMKTGARILNCARGGIVEENALYEAIQSGKIAGAALDVFEEEPATEHPLLSLPEVIATPHLGASTVEAQENVATDVSYDIRELLRGGTVRNPVNLPSVSSEMMERLAPYFKLSEQLGSFLSKVVDGTLERVNVYYSGELLDVDTIPLTRVAIKGILSHHIGDRINDVNAFKTAADKGITINEQKSTRTKGFTNLITVEVETDKEKRSLAGTLLNGLGARIVQFDQYSIDVVPEGHLVVIRHTDQPGAIGRVGSLLAEHEINIATMQVGRTNEGGEAVMVLTVDKPVVGECNEKLGQVEDIKQVQCLTI
ncbi:D-3-phosphoglycerate dehydrogenase [Halobacillus karajensis]|uniref:D-3-phosphoglycerate dehydrogenase n=1 Tax=Halobacillus karajensis TaxID=195088 RepID=A0A059NZB6_9BACI|nr:phosphoglycerate dehydrogenase [Halobacillus karajensis]CDQ18426.1 D-3-phosphoglycerate dehydrogenase [Halobacillus karajensis]CDQ23502.1 D-3-phosphoglycerate dehydrogenase [Halobacillus karajensis]CDQ26984.1 D-3-phosphoglycerate dehydrogenase [Halobacillus karajensis]SEH51541.1 D-3-phosphoglycerate dehydrogenase [Halobacillus karajensis]